ncbi:phage minor capsid protein [Amedibacterium intestinale]|uniref:phage minor capsid protein n=1 Tax=Amedibacterium intestinale TaxID=2583452 RepID=UPI000E2007E6
MSDEKEKDPHSLKDIYSEMEMELIESFYRNFAKHKIEERQRGFSWEMWQLAKLRNIQKYRRENRNIITKYIYKIKRVIESVLRNHFYDGRNNAGSNGERLSFPADKKNVGLPGKEPPKETNFFGMNEKKLNALISATKDDFENVQHAIYRKMDDVYRQTIFKTEFQLSSGSISLGKAIDKATEEFLDKGINCIIYKNGAHVNIASYAEMALRTASHRATLLGEGAKRDDLGVHLVFVSAHANACKLCIPWQGQILIDDVFSHPNDEYIAKYKEKYKLLSVAIKSGLLHPNCRHTLATYFEGITRLPKPQDPETALKNYENEQKQRQLEREVRLRKRIYAGTVDEQNKKEAKTKLLDAQKKLRDFLKEHPEFKRNQRREKIYDEQARLGSSSSSGKDKYNGEYIETIDIKEVDKYIKKYESEIKDYPIEHAYIIQRDGKVMHYTGNEIGVNFPSKNLKGAIITHSHPIIETEPSNSFQKDDFSFLQDYGIIINKLRAVYGNMRYEVQVKKDLSSISYDELMYEVSGNIDVLSEFVDFGDLVFDLLDKKGYVSYVKSKLE